MNKNLRTLPRKQYFEKSSSESDKVSTESSEQEEINVLSYTTSESDNTENINFLNENELISRDNTEWSLNYVKPNYPLSSCLRLFSGPKDHTKELINETAWSSLNLFFTDDLLDKICDYTTTYAKKYDLTFNLNKKIFKNFLGLIIAKSIYIAPKVSISALWSLEFGIKVFQNTMRRDDFKNILRFLNFDNIEIRAERILEDEFNLISEIWDDVFNNFQQYYIPNNYLTLDEQVFYDKSSYNYFQYVDNRINKYGFKIWLLTDSQSSYILNGHPYLGKNEELFLNDNFSDFIAKKLIKPFENNGYTLTTNNFFTTKTLADYLLTKNITLVGLVKRNRLFIPNKLKEKMKLNESIILYNPNYSLTSYQIKKKFCLTILSSLHKIVNIDGSVKKIPNSIEFYYKTNSGVKRINQMLKNNSAKVFNKRWPVKMFFNLLDLAIINSLVLYRKINRCQITKFEFMKLLVKELTHSNPYTENEKSLILEKRVRCKLNFCKDNRTKILCVSCKQPVCGTCSNLICKNCK